VVTGIDRAEDQEHEGMGPLPSHEGPILVHEPRKSAGACGCGNHFLAWRTAFPAPLSPLPALLLFNILTPRHLASMLAVLTF
jgi:hypothetical protein